jgi:hypothetical protein
VAEESEYIIRKVVSLTDTNYFCNRSWTISFNMNTKSWISFHSYIPNWYMAENNFFYSGKNDCCTDFDFEFVAGPLVPNSPTTTTTSTTSITTTTTSTTRIPTDCTLEGQAEEYYCVLEGTATVIGTPPTPPCIRPMGLSTFTLVTGYITASPPATIDSTYALEVACQAMSFIYGGGFDPDVDTITTITGEAYSISIGNTMYAVNGTNDCSCIANGWYFTDETAFSGNLFHITSCVIDVITNCTPTTTTTSTSTSTSTTTTTTTTAAPVACNTLVTQNDMPAYPFSQTVILGTDTGTSYLTYNSYDIPDRIIVTYDGSVVIDTGYRGHSDYNFGGISRALFNASLTGLVDPISTNTYPDFATYSDDGYPLITSGGIGGDSFIKANAAPSDAYVDMYVPMSGSIWEFTIGCPGATTTSTSTTTSTTTIYEGCVDCLPYFATTSTTTSSTSSTTTTTTTCLIDVEIIYYTTTSTTTSP